MASAKRIGQVEDRRDVELRLTVEEAEAVREVCGSIFGESKGTARAHTNSVHDALINVGIENKCSFIGSLSVKKKPTGPHFEDFVRGVFNP